MNKGMFTTNKTDWETPKWLFNLLDNEFQFDIDVCANLENTKCDLFFGYENNMFTNINEDCLSICWKTELLKNKIENPICWMNPPYGRKIVLFIKKAYEESLKGCTVVCLLPARTDTKWFHDYCTNAAEIRFLKGRLKFSNCENSAPFPSMIIIFSNKLAEHHATCNQCVPDVKFMDYKESKNEQNNKV